MRLTMLLNSWAGAFDIVIHTGKGNSIHIISRICDQCIYIAADQMLPAAHPQGLLQHEK